MAKEEVAASEESVAESGGGKKKLIMLVIIGLVLVGVSVGGTIFALKMFGSEDAAEGDGADAELVEEVEDVKRPAIYYPMKPAIIVNFQARGRQRFLQAEITLMIRDDSMIVPIETHMPMLRNSLVMLFGGQIYDELQTAEGKNILRERALVEVQKILEKETGEPVVEQVLFTSFVMQ